jgi:predicted O-methyltransferase YrrM
VSLSSTSSGATVAAWSKKFVEIRDHNVTSRARHGLPGGSTGNPDCAFLYLLVKAFQRRSIFEVGTYVGTSAVAMTMAGATS